MNDVKNHTRMYEAKVSLPEKEYREILDCLHKVDEYADAVAEKRWEEIKKDRAVLVRLQLPERDWDPDDYFIQIRPHYGMAEQMEPLANRIGLWAEETVWRQWGDARHIVKLRRDNENLERKYWKFFLIALGGWGVAIMVVAFSLLK